LRSAFATVTTSKGALQGKPPEGYSNIPKIITVDNSGNDNIIYVPVKARAGYLSGYGDVEFMETLPTFRLPGLNNATYRMFEVDGPSMAPNVLHGDRIIGEWIDELDKIRDNRVYVVVHTGGVAVKRVVNRLKERGKLYLKSDTIAHRHEFPTLEIDPSRCKRSVVRAYENKQRLLRTRRSIPSPRRPGNGRNGNETDDEG